MHINCLSLPLETRVQKLSLQIVTKSFVWLSQHMRHEAYLMYTQGYIYIYIHLRVCCIQQQACPQALADVLHINFNIKSEAHILRIRSVEYLMTKVAASQFPILNAC